jgi:hypothetical protein
MKFMPIILRCASRYKVQNILPVFENIKEAGRAAKQFKNATPLDQ